ncbi:MAG: hypothetical protein RL885_19125 [Planctomycetota bacterium]
MALRDGHRESVGSRRDPEAAGRARKKHHHHHKRSTGRHARTNEPATTCEYQEDNKEPCFLYKIQITERWKEEQPKQPKPKRARAAIEQDIKDTDQALLDVQKDIDAEHTKKKADKKVLAALRKRRDDLQERTVKLLIEFYAADAKPPAKRPKSKDRVFSVVRHMPREWVARLGTAQREMKTLTGQLTKLMKDWDAKHQEHEELKARLMVFNKETEELLREKEKAKAALERRRRRTKMREDELEAEEAKVEASQDGSLKKRWRERGRRQAEEKLDRSRTKEQDRQREYQDAEAAWDAKVDEFNDLDATEPAVYQQLQGIKTSIDAKIAEIDAIEKLVLKIRNTLVSPAIIQVVAGSKVPWYQNLEGRSHMDEKGERHHKAAGKPKDGTPKVTVEIDPDNDPLDDPPHPDGLPWGPTKIGSYCTKAEPDSEELGPHPNVDVTILPERKQDPWPFPTGEARGKQLEFEVWQAQQFDDTLQVTARTVVGQILLAGWNMFVRVIRVVKEVFSKEPRIARYTIRARACGYKPEGRTHNVSRDLQADLEVYPSDSFEISVDTSAFAGIGYSREVSRADASAPVAETGQAQYESSGSQDERTDTETFTMQAAFGTMRDTHSVTRIEGSGGVDKDLVIIQDVQQRGLTKETHRYTDPSHQNTFEGEAYSLDYHQTDTSDFSGVRTDKSIRFDETGKIVSRTDDEGNLVTNEEYRGRSDMETQSFSYDDAAVAPDAERVKRVPPYPSTFFPLCPVDISFKRNDLEDEFTQHIKSAVGNLIWITRNAAAFAGRLSNWVPAYGFGFNFTFDILSGHFSYYKQWREHIDSRVYPYSKAKLDIVCFQTSLTLWGGVWFELLMFEFKAVVEIIVSGKVGVKGELETAHPNAVVKGNRGFGPTGGIGATVRIRFVVGQADWCSASVGVRTGIDVELIAWTQHEEGPHVKWDATFTGVTAFITARLILVGGWEFERKFCKEKKIAEKRWPDLTDADILERQNAEMESLTAEAIHEAQVMSAKSEASRTKNRRRIRRGE